MSSKKAATSFIIGVNKKTGHSIYVDKKEYDEVLSEIEKMDNTDNEAIFRGQLQAILMNKFKGRVTLNCVTAKNYKELKGRWTPKKG